MRPIASKKQERSAAGRTPDAALKARSSGPLTFARSKDHPADGFSSEKPKRQKTDPSRRTISGITGAAERLGGLPLHLAVFLLCVVGTAFCSARGLLPEVNSLSFVLRLMGFTLLTILCNTLPNKKLSVIPFATALLLALLSAGKVFSGLQLLLRSASERLESLGYLAFYDKVPALTGAAATKAATKASVFILELFIAGCGLAVLRLRSAVGLLLAEFLPSLFLYFPAESLSPWAVLSVTMSNVAMWVFSANLHGGIVKSGLNEARSVPEEEQELQRQLLPTRRLIAILALPLTFFCALLCTLLLPPEGYERPEAAERIRQALLQTALYRDIMDLNDGLRTGQLTNLDDLHFTGEEALSILPEKEELLYLRAYAGSVYTGTRWAEADKRQYRTADKALDGLSPMNLRGALLSLQGREREAYSVSVKRTGGTISALLLSSGLTTPVNDLGGVRQVYDSGVRTRMFRDLRSYSFDAAPVTGSLDPLPLTDSRSTTDACLSAVERVLAALPDAASSDRFGLNKKSFSAAAEAYVRYVCDICTALPRDTAEAADALIAQYGLAAVTTADGTAVDVNATCRQVRQLLSSCSYAQSPAAIPAGEDFTTYFINVSKEGYSTHFATAAIVLLRRLGIPARYAEGYLVLPSAYEKDRSEDGYVPIEDTHAHAWAEIFDPTLLEWIPVEMIPIPGSSGDLSPDSDQNNDAVSPQWNDTGAEAPGTEGDEGPEADPGEEETAPEGDPSEGDDLGGDEEERDTGALPEGSGGTGEGALEQPSDDTGGSPDTTAPEVTEDQGAETMPSPNPEEENTDEAPSDPDATPSPSPEPEEEPEDDPEEQPEDAEDGGASEPPRSPLLRILLLVLMLLALLIAAVVLGYTIPLGIRRKQLRLKNCTKAVLFGCDHLYKVLLFLGVEQCSAADAPEDYARRITDALPYLKAEGLTELLALAEAIRFGGYRADREDRELTARRLKGILNACIRRTTGLKKLLLWYRFSI